MRRIFGRAMAPVGIACAPISLARWWAYAQVHKPRYMWGGSFALMDALHLAAFVVAVLG